MGRERAAARLIAAELALQAAQKGLRERSDSQAREEYRRAALELQAAQDEACRVLLEEEATPAVRGRTGP